MIASNCKWWTGFIQRQGSNIYKHIYSTESVIQVNQVSAIIYLGSLYAMESQGIVHLTVTGTVMEFKWIYEFK